MPTRSAGAFRLRETNGISTRLSSASPVRSIGSGVPWTSMGLCSTSWFRAAATQKQRSACCASCSEQLAQQALRCFCVAAALNQDVEHNPMLVHGTPEPMLLTGDADDNLVEMPFVSRSRKAPADLVGIILAELQRPL